MRLEFLLVFLSIKPRRTHYQLLGVRQLLHSPADPKDPHHQFPHQLPIREGQPVCAQPEQLSTHAAVSKELVVVVVVVHQVETRQHRVKNFVSLWNQC